MEPTTSAGQNSGISLYPQKLYALIAAGLAFVGMILPWSVRSGFGGLGSATVSNGFAGWGILSLFGIVGVIIATLMENQRGPYSQNMRMIGMGSFGAAWLGAFIVFMQLVGNSGYGLKTGIGVWITIIASVIGLLIINGTIKIPQKTSSTSSTPSDSPRPPVV